ncbi:unnamed protein product [Gongylonema pulchrum]|uniref:DNA-directed DNA polymerase n=1 Tax=Gongylonema pulchrum TaxID=637853 RepID=A0A183D1H2_9BILA|nr:unnamed protein product [Gongylonema pulchrum]
MYFAGIAPNSVLAKVCSDINKPNGQFRLMNEREAVLAFLKDLPLRKMIGIGPATEAILKGIGLQRCGDLYAQRGLLPLLFTQYNAEHFLRIGLGIFHVYESEETASRRKSISNEETFHATADLKTLLEITSKLCCELIESLSPRGILGGRTATVKMKYTTFDVITRCSSVEYTISDTDRLYAICSKIVQQEMHNNPRQLRLIGVRLSRLVFEDEEKAKPSLKTLPSFWTSAQANSKTSELMNDLSTDSAMPSFSYAPAIEEQTTSEIKTSNTSEITSDTEDSFDGNGETGSSFSCVCAEENSADSFHRDAELVDWEALDEYPSERLNF